LECSEYCLEYGLESYPNPNPRGYTGKNEYSNQNTGAFEDLDSRRVKEKRVLKVFLKQLYVCW